MTQHPGTQHPGTGRNTLGRNTLGRNTLGRNTSGLFAVRPKGRRFAIVRSAPKALSFWGRMRTQKSRCTHHLSRTTLSTLIVRIGLGWLS